MDGLRTRSGRSVLLTQVVRNRPRSPGITYAVLTLALALLVGAVALTSRQAAPPTIAEFAPQAVDQITESAGDHAGSRESAGVETLAGDEAMAGHDGATEMIDVARARQCVGDPPRQIEDPQSPPCVPYWNGDNGGATSRGVTRDEIRISDPSGLYGYGAPLEKFFNRRFEFYGRQIRLLPRNSGNGLSAEMQRAAGRAAYEEDEAFASTAFGADWDYVDEVARLGIVGAHYDTLFPESYLAAHRPYLWLYPMANDRLFAAMGSWYCARFAGRNAAHAGDPVMRTTRRKVGIILTDASWEGTSTEPMNAALASCGSRTDEVIESSTRWVPDAVLVDADSAAFMENAMLQMKTSGVTTVTCLCHWSALPDAMRAATNQGYFPEWLVNSYLANDWTAVMVGTERDQKNSVMALSALPMERRFSDQPSTWAVAEVGANPAATSTCQQCLDAPYHAVLVLASGIQMAGPHLTPETFERGLHRARFPNPAHRIMPGAVGFTDEDHSMTDDLAEMWWSNTTPNFGGSTGTYCYVDHGARRRIGAFRTDDPFFKGECDNGTT